MLVIMRRDSWQFFFLFVIQTNYIYSRKKKKKKKGQAFWSRYVVGGSGGRQFTWRHTTLS